MALGVMTLFGFMAIIFLWLPVVRVYYGVKERTPVGFGMAIVGTVLLGFLVLGFLAGPV
jgi:hypothetical protein